MKLTLLLNNKLVRGAALLGLSFFSLTGNAQTNVTVDAGATWVGGMLVYENTPEQAYMWYSDWGIDDVKTVRNTTDNTITLYPNYNVYGTGDDPTYWTNGELGNKIMQGMSLVIDDALVGQQFTFSGKVNSNTLIAGYTATAFVKALDANWGLINETTTTLDPGNFTIPYNAAQYVGTAHIQYGFSVKGLNGNPAAMATNGNVVITADTPQTPTNPAAVTVSLDASDAATIIGYANWYTPDNVYVNGGSYGVADLKTEINATDNTLILHPNFLAFGDGSDSEWVSNGVGTRIFEGNTYIEDDTLSGQSFNYVGHCQENTLATGYVGLAFIKIFDANYGNLQMVTAPLVGGQDFTLAGTPAAGSHVQYGYSVTGINANPAQEAALGRAVVTGITAGVAQVSKKAVTMYPNPASNVLNISAQDNINNVQIFNVLGQQVINTNPNSTTATVNVNGLNAGVYIVNTTSNGKVNSARFVKQ